MQIGVIGSGKMGSGFGSLWAQNGHQVCFSYGRSGPERLAALASAIGANARVCTPADAVLASDLILLAVPWARVEDALAQAGLLEGKVLMSCVLPLRPDASGLEIGTIRSGAEEVARHARGARCVAVSSLLPDFLHTSPHQGVGEAPSVFYCGDDAEAKAQVRALLAEIGVQPEDAGPLSAARLLEPISAFLIHCANDLGMGSNIGLRLIHRG